MYLIALNKSNHHRQKQDSFRQIKEAYKDNKYLFVALENGSYIFYYCSTWASSFGN